MKVCAAESPTRDGKDFLPAFLPCHPCLGQRLGPLAKMMLKAEEEAQGMARSQKARLLRNVHKRKRKISGDQAQSNADNDSQSDFLKRDGGSHPRTMR